MTDQGKSDHWELLASTLGAEIPPAQEAEAGTQPAQLPQPAETAEDFLASLPQTTYVLPPPKRTPADWRRLAEELGLEPPTEVELKTVEDVSEPPGLEPPIVEEAQEPPINSVIDHVESPQLVVTSFEPPVMEEPELERPEREFDDERRGRRRHKRRRRDGRPVESGIERESEEALEAAPEAIADIDTPAEFEDFLDLPSEPLVGEEGFVEPTSEVEVEFEADSDAPATRRRRRRRRGRRDREAPGVGASEAGDEEAVEALDEPESETADLADDEFHDEDDESVGDDREKAMHRAIPSWSEAVDIIISANLESRARHPERRTSHRPRGRGD